MECVRTLVLAEGFMKLIGMPVLYSKSRVWQLRRETVKLMNPIQQARTTDDYGWLMWRADEPSLCTYDTRSVSSRSLGFETNSVLHVCVQHEKCRLEASPRSARVGCVCTHPVRPR